MKNKKRPIFKIVCVCRGGNVRSVALKRILHRYFGHETIAVGLDRNGPELLTMLFDWSDFIVVAHNDFVFQIPFEYTKKTVPIHLGNDIWGESFHEDLQEKAVDAINKVPIFHLGRTLTKEKVLKDIRDYRAKLDARKDSSL